MTLWQSGQTATCAGSAGTGPILGGRGLRVNNPIGLFTRKIARCCKQNRLNTHRTVQAMKTALPFATPSLQTDRLWACGQSRGRNCDPYGGLGPRGSSRPRRRRRVRNVVSLSRAVYAPS